MLRSLKALEDYKVNATDGDIGSVRDFYFDDEHWTVRYLVVDTGGFWAGPSQVLISPIAFGNVDWTTRKFHLDLLREKVKNSPHIGLDKPVSREYERDYFRYYNWPYYWGYGGVWGDWGYPGVLAKTPWSEPLVETPPRETHRISVREVSGYRIMGSDEEIGHVQDIIVDDESWAIRYLVVDTRNWWSGKSVILAPHWIERIDPATQTVHINLPREVIKNSPEWMPDQPVNREYEMRLYDYYGRPAYWPDDKKPA